MTAAKSPSKPCKGSGFRRKSAHVRQSLKPLPEKCQSVKSSKFLNVKTFIKGVPHIKVREITSIDYEVYAKQLHHRRQRQLIENSFPACHRVKHQHLRL